MVIPLVAAALVGTMVVVGVTAVRDRQRVVPAETASPVPTTASPPPADCVRHRDPHPPEAGDRAGHPADDQGRDRERHHLVPSPGRRRRPRPLGTPTRTGTPWFSGAPGGPAPASTEVRVLIIEDGASYWSLRERHPLGRAAARSPSERRTARATGRGGGELNGGFSSACDRDQQRWSAASASSSAARWPSDGPGWSARSTEDRGRRPNRSMGLVAFPFTLDGDAAGSGPSMRSSSSSIGTADRADHPALRRARHADHDQLTDRSSGPAQTSQTCGARPSR